MDKKQKLEEIKLIDPDWKLIIFSLYQNGEVYFPDNLEVDSSDFYSLSDGITQFSRIEKLLELKINLSDCKGINDIALKHAALIKAKSILKDLTSLELVDKVEWQVTKFEEFNFNMTRYSLNKNGLDFILRFQEHRDNEKRHRRTVTNSKNALGVSILALCAVIFSAYLNYHRLDLYEKQLEKVVSNQSTILEKTEAPKVIQE